MMTSAQVVETPVITTDNSPSRYYTHPDGQSTLLHVTPGSNHLLEDLTLFGVESKAIIIFI